VAGINRAIYENRQLAKANDSANGPCIFLSHISVDKSSAIAIGSYITAQGGIDIYLDNDDKDLQQAVSTHNPVGITQFIERGLSFSTHIMCLVSASTVKSWWVPYELGFAKKAGKYLSTLKLKGDVDLPEFLAIGEIVTGTKSLNNYLTRVRRGLGKAVAVDSLTETLIRDSVQGHPLDAYLDWKL
jgi:hypothetical protein